MNGVHLDPMQMRKFCYQTGSKKQRADVMRADAVTLARRGFPGLAEVNRELADHLDPYVRQMATDASNRDED